MKDKINDILDEFDEWHRKDTNASILYSEVQEEYRPLDWEDENERIKEWWRVKLNNICN